MENNDNIRKPAQAEESSSGRLTDEQKAMLTWKFAPGDANRFVMGEKSVPEKKTRASADSWNIKPMSDKTGTLVMNEFIRSDNMEIIRMGHIPEVQEDHWFIWCDDSHIRIYRSWTGACMYDAEYEKCTDADGYMIKDVKVNLDRDELTTFGPEASACLFMTLIRAEIATRWKNAVWLEHAMFDKFIDNVDKGL